jgi:hypothetical protein
MARIATTEEFVSKSILVHQNAYDYSLVEYKGNKIKVKIICPIHGVFEQIPSNHMCGKGCRYCFSKIRFIKEEFIAKANIVHNKIYDYSLVQYNNTKKRVKIICPIHGVFSQTPGKHLTGRGCSDCGVIVSKNAISKIVKIAAEKFIFKSKLIHKNKYDYSLVNYINANTKVSIICPVHGLFVQEPNHHLSGCGCRGCNKSKGENLISYFLQHNNIEFITQKIFPMCFHKNNLPFDFYLPKHNVCIEYNGEQHYREVEYFGGSKKFNERQKNDSIKLDFCRKNEIELIIIRYDENIKEVLIKRLLQKIKGSIYKENEQISSISNKGKYSGIRNGL